MFTKATIIVLSLVGVVILIVVGAIAIFIGAFVVHDVKTKIEKNGPHYSPPDNSPPPPKITAPPGGFRPPPSSAPSFPSVSKWTNRDDSENSDKDKK